MYFGSALKLLLVSEVAQVTSICYKVICTGHSRTGQTFQKSWTRSSVGHVSDTNWNMWKYVPHFVVNGKSGITDSYIFVTFISRMFFPQTSAVTPTCTYFLFLSRLICIIYELLPPVPKKSLHFSSVFSWGFNANIAMCPPQFAPFEIIFDRSGHMMSAFWFYTSFRRYYMKLQLQYHAEVQFSGPLLLWIVPEQK
jgi:hypothetical protein